MANTETVNDRQSRGQLQDVVRAKRGQRVEVFNRVSDNWHGTVVAVNKNTARVRVESKIGVFTDHAYARNWMDSEHEEYLVPFSDLREIGPNDRTHSPLPAEKTHNEGA